MGSCLSTTIKRYFGGGFSAANSPFDWSKQLLAEKKVRPKKSNLSFCKRKFCHDHLSNLKLLFGQVPRDPEDSQGAERQKEAQRLIDEAEPLNEEEVTEKEQLLQEVHLVWKFILSFVVNFSGNNDRGYKARGRGIYPWPRLHHQGLGIKSKEKKVEF